jgi:hypothetical protein
MILELSMSRAFLKEDAQAPEALPDRRISPHPNDVTQEGLTHLEQMLNEAREAHAAALAAQDRDALAHASRDCATGAPAVPALA